MYEKIYISEVTHCCAAYLARAATVHYYHVRRIGTNLPTRLPQQSELPLPHKMASGLHLKLLPKTHKHKQAPGAHCTQAG